MSTATLPRSRQAPPTAPVAGSAVYVGWVTHRRRSPVEHRFRYPTAMLLLDLDELPGALEGHRHWGVERRALFAFRRRDHHGDPAVPLAEALRRTAAEATGRWAGGPVRLLCQPRTLGRSFNPVTFAYLHDADRQLDAVVAEVTNTPWGERHAYVLDARAAADPERPATTLDKAFHVSPFMGMDHRYRWTTTVPGRRSTSTSPATATANASSTRPSPCTAGRSTPPACAPTRAASRSAPSSSSRASTARPCAWR